MNADLRKGRGDPSLISHVVHVKTHVTRIDYVGDFAETAGYQVTLVDEVGVSRKLSLSRMNLGLFVHADLAHVEGERLLRLTTVDDHGMVAGLNGSYRFGRDKVRIDHHE